MQPRERFTRAVRFEAVDRPPAWIMRQAGRYLPEYRKLKQEHDFLTLVRTPELATEVTLQPLRRFPLDCAILFSDILVIPEALGQPYHFRDEGGIGMDFALESAADIDRLTPEAIPERLDYVAGALRLIRAELPEHALLGFGGSPWTLASYMIEGGSTRDFSRLLAFCSEQPALFNRLMEKLSGALIDYFHMQIEAGADAIQIFDSWAAASPAEQYEAFSLRWIRQIREALPADFPIILYAKGVGDRLEALASTGANVLSLDWTIDLPQARDQLNGRCALQGNLDPQLLNEEPEAVVSAAKRLLTGMPGPSGHVLNLGHGIEPTARIESVAALLETVTNWRYEP